MIYLDYQASTVLAPEARAAMEPWLGECYANPHAQHRMGNAGRAAIEVAREQVGALIEPSCRIGRSFFTSGATEAVNWALKGLFWSSGERRKLVVVATEHACVLDTAVWLAGQGIEVVTLPVGADGIVDLAAAAVAIDARTTVVACMLVNNEIGVVQPMERIAALARAAGALVLCDAVQAYGRVPIPLAACDMIAVSAHKIHGPKGVGMLWLRDGVAIEPLLHGGGQEGGIRSGTLSPALCVGFGAAAALAATRWNEDAAHVESLWTRAVERLGPAWIVNGSAEHRYRGNLNLRRPGVDADRLFSELRGIAFSTGSACASGSGRASHVLAALGLDAAAARSSVRLGFGRYTTAAEIDEAIGLISAAADRIAGPVA